MLSQPLRDRFGIQAKLEMYSPDQLSIIIDNSSKVLSTVINKNASMEIARRSRGTPRIANRLLKRVRDFAEVKGQGEITLDIAKFALSTMEIDEIGLDVVDKAFLNALIDKFNGGPAGIDAIASVIGEDSNTLEDVYEPYLMQLGFVVRTLRGRIAMPSAYTHLKKKIPQDKLNVFDSIVTEDNKDNNENK